MKKMNISLGDVYTMSYNTIGNYLLKFRRKKKINSEQYESKPKHASPIIPKSTPPELAKPTLPDTTPKADPWNSTPFSFRSPYCKSSYFHQTFFNPSSGNNTPLLSPPGVTAFTPYRIRPSIDSNEFTIFKGTYLQ
jgi:hypothetical protein